MKAVSRIIILFIACLTHQLSAQSFKERLQLIQNEYTGLESVHLRMKIEVFENDKAAKPFYSELADIKKQEDYYHYEFGSLNMLMNADYIIMVDKSAREVVCTKRSIKDEKAFNQDPFQMNLDSILSLYDKPDFLGKQMDVEHYRVQQKNGSVRQIDLFINSKTNVLSRLEYRYEDDHFVVIDFTLFDKQPGFADVTFSANQYVSSENGRLRLARAYYGYHLTLADKNP